MRAVPPPGPFVQARHRRRRRATSIAGAAVLLLTVVAVTYPLAQLFTAWLAGVLVGG